MLYRNKKNGKIYQKHYELLDCTNERDGTVVVAYSLQGEPAPRFVREAHEFIEKFEPLNLDAQSALM